MPRSGPITRDYYLIYFQVSKLKILNRRLYFFPYFYSSCDCLNLKKMSPFLNKASRYRIFLSIKRDLSFKSRIQQSSIFLQFSFFVSQTDFFRLEKAAIKSHCIVFSESSFEFQKSRGWLKKQNITS